MWHTSGTEDLYTDLCIMYCMISIFIISLATLYTNGYVYISLQKILMSRVKKQLHEWDENLKDESLPTNPTGTHWVWAHRLFQAHTRSQIVRMCLSLCRFLIQGGRMSTNRWCSTVAATEDWQCHPETALWVGHHGPGVYV